MRRRRSASAGLAIFALSLRAWGAPPVRLHVAEESTCEGILELGTRLAARDIVVSESAADGINVDVRAMSTPAGASAELVVRRGDGIATRSLRAPTCDEVLDALVFTLGLALEQPLEPTPPAKSAAATSSKPDDTPPIASVRPRFGWGAGVGAGVFAGASPSAAAALKAYAGLESRAPRFVAPSVILGATFVLPSTTKSLDTDVSFALQMGTVDGCPVRLGGRRITFRPCRVCAVRGAGGDERTGVG